MEPVDFSTSPLDLGTEEFRNARFYTDGSGGPFAADDRLRTCAWSNAIIFPLEDGVWHFKCGWGAPLRVNYKQHLVRNFLG